MADQVDVHAMTDDEVSPPGTCLHSSLPGLNFKPETRPAVSWGVRWPCEVIYCSNAAVRLQYVDVLGERREPFIWWTADEH